MPGLVPGIHRPFFLARVAPDIDAVVRGYTKTGSRD